MSEWWTYRPADFLMFAPRTYWRLFELHNAAWWPAPPLLLLAGLAGLVWMLRSLRTASQTRRGGLAPRAGAVGLAAAWAFVAGSFLLQRYAPINWAASAYAGVFFAQALGLAALAAAAGLRAAASPARRRTALLLGLWALLGHPLLAPAFGRPWAQAEVFALAPDPTVIATLAFLLAVDAPGRPARWLWRALWLLALAWCAVSAATLWTMGSAQGWVLLAAALASVAAAGPGPRR